MGGKEKVGAEFGWSFGWQKDSPSQGVANSPIISTVGKSGMGTYLGAGSRGAGGTEKEEETLWGWPSHQSGSAGVA